MKQKIAAMEQELITIENSFRSIEPFSTLQTRHQISISHGDESIRSSLNDLNDDGQSNFIHTSKLQI